MTDFKAWIAPEGAVVAPPVHPETIVDVIYSDRTEGENLPARCLNWSSVGDGPCIVAYAVVREYREPLEGWAVSVYLTARQAKQVHPGCTPFFVREVLE